MSFFDFVKRRGSAPVARERLQILLEYERCLTGQTDLVAVLRDEILAVVERHVVVNREKVRVRVERRGEAISILRVGVEIPNARRIASASRS
jgi:cell division topological specificity factor